MTDVELDPDDEFLGDIAVCISAYRGRAFSKDGGDPAVQETHGLMHSRTYLDLQNDPLGRHLSDADTQGGMKALVNKLGHVVHLANDATGRPALT